MLIGKMMLAIAIGSTIGTRIVLFTTPDGNLNVAGVSGFESCGFESLGTGIEPRYFSSIGRTRVGVERADERDGELARVRVRRVEVLARAKRAHLSNVRRFQRPRHVRPPVREVSNRLVEQRVRIPRPVPNRLLLHPQDRFELLRNEHVSDVRREQRVYEL